MHGAMAEELDTSEERKEIQGPTAMVLQLLIIAAAASSLVTPIYSSSFFRHLATGRWIKLNGELPEVNLWTMFAYGKYWVSSSWLFDYLLADIDAWFAYSGLVVFKVAVPTYNIIHFCACAFLFTFCI